MAASANNSWVDSYLEALVSYFAPGLPVRVPRRLGCLVVGTSTCQALRALCRVPVFDSVITGMCRGLTITTWIACFTRSIYSTIEIILVSGVDSSQESLVRMLVKVKALCWAQIACPYCMFPKRSG